MNIESGILYTCNETCEMNVSAVLRVRAIVRIRPTEANGSHAMFATEQRWSGVFTTNEKRIISTSRERAVVREILTEKHHPRKKTIGSVVGNKIFRRIGSKTFSVDRFSCVTNFGCEKQKTSLPGNDKETNVFKSIFNRPDGTSFNHIANETHEVSPTGLEKWINVTTSLVPNHINNLRNKTKHTLLIRIRARTRNKLYWHDSRAVSEELPRRTQKHLVV